MIFQSFIEPSVLYFENEEKGLFIKNPTTQVPDHFTIFNKEFNWKNANHHEYYMHALI